MSKQLLRPRTEGERKAYEAGYAQAVLDVQERGTNFVRDALRLMGDMEPVPPTPSVDSRA